MILIMTIFFGICVFISLILMILKWAGLITLSWWIITAPIWGGYGAVCITLCILLLIAAISDRTSRKKQ